MQPVLYFLLRALKTLLSYYKNDVKWSENALSKPVIQPFPLWAENIDETVLYFALDKVFLQRRIFILSNWKGNLPLTMSMDLVCFARFCVTLTGELHELLMWVWNRSGVRLYLDSPGLYCKFPAPWLQMGLKVKAGLMMWYTAQTISYDCEQCPLTN